VVLKIGIELIVAVVAVTVVTVVAVVVVELLVKDLADWMSINR